MQVIEILRKIELFGKLNNAELLKAQPDLPESQL